jgi:anti-sigma regulatory factor (Ser/Thr protein kinase)
LVGVMLQHTELSEREVRQLRSALQEMGMNAIEWGNRNDTTKLVKITCHVGSEEISVHVEDEGEGFDPRNLPHAASPDADDPTRHMAVREILGLREGGFGILITRGLVDEVIYNETGNRVTLTKRIGNHTG